VLIAAIAAVTIAIVAAVVLNRPSAPANIAPSPSSTTEIPLGRSLGVRGLAITTDAVWVTSQGDAELYRVDPATDQIVATYSIPDHVDGVLAAGGSLWLTRYDPNDLLRVDPGTGAVTGRVAFDSEPNPATDGSRLWVVAERGGSSKAVEIDPGTAGVVREIAVDTPPGFAALDGGDLWFASFGTTEVVRVDLDAGQVAQTVDVGGEPRDVAVVDGTIWAAINKAGVAARGSVVRIDGAAGKVTARVNTGRRIHSLAGDGSMLWVTNFDDGTLSVVDTTTMALVATTPIAGRPGGVAAGHGSIWVTPHRRAVLVRIDPTQPLEAAALPDLYGAFEVADGTIYIRCSGSGSPTVLLESNQGDGSGAWSVVEARLSRTTRVCSYDRVGVADLEQAGQAGPAGTIAFDLGTVLAAAHQRGPYVVVGQMVGALYAEMFVATHREDVIGLVLVDPVSPDFFDRMRPLLTPEAQAQMDDGLEQQAEMRSFAESAAQVAAVGGFGDLPLVVVSTPTEVADLAAAAGVPAANAEAVARLIESTRRDQVALSTRGRLVTSSVAGSNADVVSAVKSLDP
jgi:YVTN family beta-propeller protein